MLRRSQIISRSSSSSSLLRPTLTLHGKTNRYTDGTGRPMDGSSIPTDLYLPPLNDTDKEHAYPARTDVWQPMVAGKPSPYRGSIVVTGAGVVGSTAAILFGLRGWHVTVIEQELPAALGGDGTDISSGPRSQQSYECALMTKRGMDVLHSAGLRHKDIAALGTKVTGMLDHPSPSVSTLFTRGLSELHSFSVNNVCVDMFALKQRLHTQLNRMPHQNGKIFYQHRAVAHLPEQKVVVVKPLAMDTTKVESEADLNTEEKGVSIHGVRFEEYVEGINYDLLVAADGRDSSLRRLMGLDDGAQHAEKGFATAWFVMENCDLDPTVIHRWLHTSPNAEDNPLKEYPVVFAFPRGTDTGCFSVMAFVPSSVANFYFGDEALQKHNNSTSSSSSSSNSNDKKAESSSKEVDVAAEEAETRRKVTREDLAYEFAKNWCPEVLGTSSRAGAGTVMAGTVSAKPKPAPSLFLMDHYNVHTPFPNSILVGEAAHSCNPFLLQNLAVALEDCAYAVNIMDAKQTINSYDRIRNFSAERGVAADRLRNITDRSLYYHRNKHWNHLLRFRNFYAHAMHILCPRIQNEQIHTNSNFRYPRSVEAMLNGRGYTSYEETDSAQVRTNRFYAFARLFT